MLMPLADFLALHGRTIPVAVRDAVFVPSVTRFGAGGRKVPLAVQFAIPPLCFGVADVCRLAVLSVLVSMVIPLLAVFALDGRHVVLVMQHAVVVPVFFLTRVIQQRWQIAISVQ
jgi:hypothetical protein